MSSHAEAAPSELPPFARYPEGAEIQTYKGGCHCHKFAFEFKHPALDLKKPIACNCTLCTRTGALYSHGPEKMFHLDASPTSWDELSNFVSKSRATTHYFCPACGSFMFWKGMGLVGVNVRMIEGIEVHKLSVNHVDGRSRP